MNTLRNTFLAILICLFTISCKNNQSPRFQILGNITSAKGDTLYFEQLSLTGVQTLDKKILRESGEFLFCGNKPSCPEFYRLRLQNNIINIVVDSTETIKVTADSHTMGSEYTIDGSPDSKTIQEISNRLLSLQAEIREIWSDPTLTNGRQEYLFEQAVQQYKNKIKKEFILPAPHSPAAYFALFQTLGDQLIFNPRNDHDDIRYFAAVATAWDELYPDEPRTLNLHNIAIRGLSNIRPSQTVALEDIVPADKISVRGFIDIELPDITGKTTRLSDIEDKVIMLDFTAYALPTSKERILQMRKLYDSYQSRGFTIFQVSIDPDEHYWKTACEHLPWICVRDQAGENSDYIGFYRITRLPQYYIIDRNGDIVSRDEEIVDLEALIEQLCGR